VDVLEQKSRKRKKRADLQKVVLHTIATAGLLSVALVAPNVVVALSKLGMLPNRRQTDSIRRARNQLVQKGFLVWEGNKLRITEMGKKKLQSLELREYKLPKPKRWDGRWRVLIFDIPERRRVLRDKVRRTLAAVGFIRLQDSVWIYPYDCEELITLLKADFKIGKDMLYMIVDTLEFDTPIRARFGLE
jgi:DNA-binding transcriptional regulator PaaX